MVAPVNDRDVMLQAATRDLDPRANKYLNLTVTTPIFHVGSNGVASPSTITISATPVNIGGGTVVFSVSAGTLTGSGNSRTLDFTNMPVDSVTITASITDLGQTYTATQIISKVVDGATGRDGSSTAAPMYASPQLYKWSTTQPSLPTGSSTWAWSTGSNTGYLGSDGWYTTAPANPGTPGIQLWVVTKPITAASGTDTTNVTYTSGASLVAISANGTQGVAGIKSERACVYAWAIGPAPTISGTSVYTWSTQSFNSVPAGWSATKPDAPALGYTLFEASVGIVETTGADTTNVDWTQAKRVGIGYVATNGAVGPTGNSIAVAYTLVTGNTLAGTPATYVASGTNLPATGTWGETRAWTSQPSVPAAGQSVFQSIGVYNGTNTTWGLPFLSSFRVGNLSAVAVDTGSLNVSGTISSSNGNFSVDSNGYAAMKSIKVTTAAGDVLLDTSATYQITTTNVAKFIQPSSIGNTQIGGNIQSTNWNGSTGTGGTGWILDRTGNFYANSVQLRGAIMSGAYTAWAWPAAGSTGYYLGSEGLLIGDYNSNRYFQVTSNGNVFAPGFSIVNGAATFSGALNAASGSFSGTLNAASGTLGTITAATIQSGSSGQRTVINQNGVNVYDGNSTLRVRLGIW